MEPNQVIILALVKVYMDAAKMNTESNDIMIQFVIASNRMDSMIKNAYGLRDHAILVQEYTPAPGHVSYLHDLSFVPEKSTKVNA